WTYRARRSRMTPRKTVGSFAAMRSARRVFVVLAVSLAGIALPPNPLGAQPSPRGASGQWLPPENGQMPRNAVVLRAVDGAPEYICQAVIAGGPALGIASGGV